jgi:hypothetical protein
MKYTTLAFLIVWCSSCTLTSVSSRVVTVTGAIGKSIFRRGCKLEVLNENGSVHDSRNLLEVTAKEDGTVRYEESFVVANWTDYTIAQACGNGVISKKNFYAHPFQRESRLHMGLTIEITQ